MAGGLAALCGGKLLAAQDSGPTKAEIADAVLWRDRRKETAKTLRDVRLPDITTVEQARALVLSVFRQAGRTGLRLDWHEDIPGPCANFTIKAGSNAAGGVCSLPCKAEDLRRQVLDYIKVVEFHRADKWGELQIEQRSAITVKFDDMLAHRENLEEFWAGVRSGGHR